MWKQKEQNSHPPYIQHYNSAGQKTAFLLISLPKLLPKCILLHKSKQIDFVIIATDSQEAASCHFKNVSSPVSASIFKNVVKTPTFLSLKQSDLSTQKTPKSLWCDRSEFQKPRALKRSVEFWDTVTPLSVLPPSGKLWINLSKPLSWRAQVYQRQKTVSGVQVSNAIPRLGGHSINSKSLLSPTDG